MLCQSTPRWAQVRLNPPISCLTLFGSPVPPLSFPSLSLVLQNRRNFPCPGGQWEPIPAGLGCHQGAAPRTPGPIWEFQFISTQEVNDAQRPRNSIEFLWPCLKGCETWWNFLFKFSFISFFKVLVSTKHLGCKVWDNWFNQVPFLIYQPSSSCPLLLCPGVSVPAGYPLLVNIKSCISIYVILILAWCLPYILNSLQLITFYVYIFIF